MPADLETVIVVDDDDARKSLDKFDKRVGKSAKAQEEASRRSSKAKSEEATVGERASRRTAKGKSLEAQAIQRNEKLQKRALTSIERAEKRAATFGLRGAARLKAQERQLLATARAAGVGAKEIGRVSRSFRTMERRMKANIRGGQSLRRSFASMAARSVLAAAGIASMGVALKKLLVDTALYAARSETLGVALDVVARNMGVSSQLISVQERELRRMGLTLHATRTILARFAATGLPVERIRELVGLGRDLAVVMGGNTSEAVIRLTRAIVNQEVEILRTAGLNIKFETGHKRLAKQLGTTTDKLTDLQRATANFNIVVEQGRSFVGTYVNALDTTGKKLTSLPRLFDDLSQAIGERFKSSLDTAVAILSIFIVKATEALNLQSLIEAAAGRKLQEVSPDAPAAAFRQLGPGRYGLAGGFSTTGPGAQAARDVITRQRRSGGSLLTDEIVLGPHQEQFMKALRAPSGATGVGLPAFGRKLAEENSKLVDANRERRSAAEKQASDLAAQANLRQLAPLERINAERKKYLELLGKTPAAIRDINRVFDIQLRLEEKRLSDELARQQRTLAVITSRVDTGPGADAEAALKRQEIEGLGRVRVAAEIRDANAAAEAAALGRSRDMQLAQIAAVGSETIGQKIALEGRKLDIEVDFLERSAELKKAWIRINTEREIAANRGLQKVLLAQQTQRIKTIDEATADAVLAAEERAATGQARILADHHKQVFDNLKRQAEGVFDALITRSQGFFETLGNLMKTALLTAIKEIVTSRVASMLMGLFQAGGPLAAASGGRGGGRGRLSGLFGLGGFAVPGLGGVSRPGAPGGTPGFGGPVALPGGGGALPLLSLPGASGGGAAVPAGGGGATQAAGLLDVLGSGNLTAVRDLFGLGSSISTKAGATTFQAATLGQKFGSFAGSTGGALVGAGLLAAGLYRGGLSGIGLSAAGGALLGFKFGGPLGAAIGAVAGAGAGLVRSLFSKATEKARRKIRNVYGVDVSDKGILRQIVDTARGQFGGHLDTAIRSPGVRDLIELYSAATGQDFSGFSRRITPVHLVQFEGGALAQRTQFRLGRPIALESPLPVIGPDGRQGTTVIQLDAQATTNLLEGRAARAIVNNPRMVQDASLEASSQNFGRRESVAVGLEPRALLA